MAQADEIWNHGPELMDDDGEIRELTATDFATFRPFSELPEELQQLLVAVNEGHVIIAPEPSLAEEVTLKLSKPVLARFRASGTGWENRLDDALLQWMEEHKAS